MEEVDNQQMEKFGYCKQCKRVVQWVKHANFNYYVCGTEGCYNRSEDPDEEEEPTIKPQYFHHYKIEDEQI